MTFLTVDLPGHRIMIRMDQVEWVEVCDNRYFGRSWGGLLIVRYRDASGILHEVRNRTKTYLQAEASYRRVMTVLMHGKMSMELDDLLPSLTE